MRPLFSLRQEKNDITSSDLRLKQAGATEGRIHGRRYLVTCSGRYRVRAIRLSHEIAKSILENAKDIAERLDAIERAMQLGMPLSEIQDYLDWLDSSRGPSGASGRRPDNGSNK